MRSRVRRGIAGVASVAGAAALALGLAGCGLVTVHGPAARPDPAHPIAAARKLDGAPQLVRDTTTPTCGETVLGQGEELPDAALTCLASAARDGTAADLAWSSPTTEGDPIVSFAFVRAGQRGAFVVSTSAFDSYGGDGDPWRWSHCPDPRHAFDSVGCSESDGPTAGGTA